MKLYGRNSGAEDVAVIEYEMLTGRPFSVLSRETYRILDAVEKHYNIHIEQRWRPSLDAKAWCRSTKMGTRSPAEPGRMLKGVHAWITKERKDQSLGTRANIPVIQVDYGFGDVNGLGSLIKWNPPGRECGWQGPASSNSAFLPSGRWTLQSRHRRWKPRIWSRLANKVGKLCAHVAAAICAETSGTGENFSSSTRTHLSRSNVPPKGGMSIRLLAFVDALR